MRLEKFLYCFELELGGIIIGFYHLVMYCILMISAVVAFVLALIYGEDINLILLVVGLIVVLVIALFLLYISWQLIMGVEFRDHRRVQKFRIVCFIGLLVNVVIVIAAFTQIERFDLNVLQLVFLILCLFTSFITQVYIALVIDSVFRKFREEEFPTSYSPSNPQAFKN